MTRHEFARLVDRIERANKLNDLLVGHCERLAARVYALEVHAGLKTIEHERKDGADA